MSYHPYYLPPHLDYGCMIQWLVIFPSLIIFSIPTLLYRLLTSFVTLFVYSFGCCLAVRIWGSIQHLLLEPFGFLFSFLFFSCILLYSLVVLAMRSNDVDSLVTP